MNRRTTIMLMLGFVTFAIWIGFSAKVDRFVALNTLILGTAVNLISLPLGLIIARTCGGTERFSRFTLGVCLGFLFLPLFVHVSSWDAAFGKLGWLTGISTTASGTVAPWAMAIWIHSIAAIAPVAIIIWLGLRMSGRVHEERASLDADANSIFWHITLPKLIPLIALAIVWNFVVCAREIAVTDIYRIGTLAEQIYLGYSLSDFDSMSGSMTTVLLIAIVAMAAFAAFVPTFENYTTSSDMVTKKKEQRTSLAQKLATTLILAMMIIAPAINLVARASRSVEFIDEQPIVSYSISNLLDVVSRVPATYFSEFCWSATIALTSTICLMLISLLLIWRANSSRVGQLVLITAVAFTCSLPGPLIGSSLLEIRSITNISFIHWLFDRTIFAPVVANVLFCFPLAVLTMWFLFHNRAADVEDSMAVEGAGGPTRLLHTLLIPYWPSLLGSLLIVFAISFGELSATQLAVPPGIDTIPRRMLGLLHSGVNDHTAGLTIVSVCMVLLLISTGFGLFNWNRPTHGE